MEAPKTNIQKCKVSDINLWGNYANSANSYLASINFNNINDFTNLLLLDIFHDYYTADHKLVITDDQLYFICDIVRIGIYESMKTEIDCYNSILHILIFITNGTYIRGINNRGPDIEVSDFEDKCVYYFGNNIKILNTDINDNLSVDTCRNVSKTPLCNYYNGKSTNHKFLTLATTADPGFINIVIDNTHIQHVNYNFCDTGVNFDLRPITIQMTCNGVEFSRFKYLSRSNIYRANIKYGERGRTRWIQTRIHSKNTVINNISNVYHADKRNLNYNMCQLLLYNEIFDRFYGDFGQITNVYCINSVIRGTNNISIMTSDVMMAIIGLLVFPNNTIYTNWPTKNNHRPVRIQRTLKKLFSLVSLARVDVTQYDNMPN